MREQSPQRANGYAVSRDLNPRLVAVASLIHFGRETRKHPPRQIKKLTQGLNEWGFVLPIIIDEVGHVVSGWGLVLAARRLGLAEVPAVTITDLSEAQLRALRLSLNKLGEGSEWNPQELVLEFSEIQQLEPDLDLTLTGFEMAEIDIALGGDADEEDELPVVAEQSEPVTKTGDIWVAGDHRIICGDALEEATYGRLLDEEKAQMVVTDPPYNLSIPGHVSGLGSTKHQNFQMASGEMSSEEFIAFLMTCLGLVARHSIDGSIHYIFMDWRHQIEILTAGRKHFSELKNLCVWKKSNAGMGSLYRSQHELIFVFKKGEAPHVNNIELGRCGRNRSNIWDYPSQNALNGTAKSKLSLHPTVKPVGLIADAIRDCSNRGGIVLDPFGGAGTTLIAAERTGRKARLIEIEPRYVDVTIERWQRLTGRTAVNAATGNPFGG